MNTNEALRRLGIDELNYMQQECIAAYRKNNNIILISPTGSGKTYLAQTLAKQRRKILVAV